MRKMGFLRVATVFFLAVGLLFPGAGEAAPVKKITIATAGIGGAYYPVGTGIAKLVNRYVPGVEVRVEVTGGGLANPRLVGSGETDLGICNASQGNLAIKGKKPYTKKYPVQSLAHMYPSVFHMVTREDFPFRTLADLKGGRIAVGPAGGELTISCGSWPVTRA